MKIVIKVAKVIIIIAVLLWLFWHGISLNSISIAIAGLGGVIIFAGHWIEKKSDLKRIEVHHPNYLGDNSLAIRNSKWGWRILMAGIIIEIVVACVEVKKNEDNAPMNQQAQSAKAIVSFLTEGTNDFNNLQHNFNAYLGISSKLAFGDPPLMETGAPTMYSPVLRMALHSEIRHGTNIEWRIFFDRDEDIFADLVPKVKVGDVINWKKFEIGIPFLAAGTKIWQGQIVLTINDQITTNLIESQMVRGTNECHAFWDSPANGVAFFSETNEFRWVPR